MRVLTVVGTRPELIKAAALQPALRTRHDHVFVDTGQHYDREMSGDFFDELGLSRPDHSLGVASGDHGEQTGRMLIALEQVLMDERPDAVLVDGDTNSTLAGALAAAKLGIPVGHVEAGLRSFDRAMPEELNRIVVDHLSTWLFAPTPAAVANLAAEGIREGVVRTGDLMQDLAARVSRQVRDPGILAAISRRLWPRNDRSIEAGRYLFATVHRQENREPAAIAAWTRLLDAIARPGRPVILALHPGTKAAVSRAGESLGPNVCVIEPQGYRTTIALQLHAAVVLTDSGGMQREAAWLRTPCLVLRRTTEWVEAVERSEGRMVLVGVDRDLAVSQVERLAPIEQAPVLAARRAASLDVEETGTAEAIAEALESREPRQPERESGRSLAAAAAHGSGT